MTAKEILRIIYWILAIGGGVFGLLNYRRMPRAFFWLSVYLLAAGAIQIGAYFSAVKWGTNIVIYNIATFVYLSLFFGIFWSFSSEIKYRKRVLIWFLIGLAVLCFRIIPHINESSFLPGTVMVFNLVIAAAALHSFYQMLKYPSTLRAIRQGLFWLITALFFYHVSSLAFWAMTKYLFISNRAELVYLLGYTNAVLVTLFYALAWVSIFVAKREPSDIKEQ